MTFDYRKFLAENDLTATARLRSKFIKEADDAGMAAGKQSGARAAKLQKLVAQKDEILAKYKSGEISLDQYRTQIGNIPQQIKQLRLDMSDELNPAAGTDEEGGEQLVTAPKGFDGGDADVSGIEAGALQKMAGGSQYPDDMGDDEDTPPSRFDKDYYQGDDDEIQEAELSNQQPVGKPAMPGVPPSKESPFKKPAMPGVPPSKESPFKKPALPQVPNSLKEEKSVEDLKADLEKAKAKKAALPKGLSMSDHTLASINKKIDTIETAIKNKEEAKRGTAFRVNLSNKAHNQGRKK